MANPERGGNFITRPLRRGTEMLIDVGQGLDVVVIAGGFLIGRPDLVLFGFISLGAGVVGKNVIKEKPQTKASAA